MPDLLFNLLLMLTIIIHFLVSKSADEIFELTAADFTNDIKFVIYDRILQQDRERFFQSLVTARKEIKPWDIEFRAILPKKEFVGLKFLLKQNLL